MPDEPELIIGRLCQCGRRAGHNSICRRSRVPAGLPPDDLERVDGDWEDRHAGRRAEQHAQRQPSFRADRDRARSGMGNDKLRVLAEVRAAKLSPISAGNIAPSHGSAGHPSANLALQVGAVDFGQDPRWSASEEMERRALLRRHELLDEYEGLGVARPDQELTPEAKDAEIVAPHNDGLSAAEFSRQYPGYGSPSTVARKRRWFRGGFCTFNGLPPRPGCRCPTCRRASG